MVPLGCDGPPHEVEQIRREQRVSLEVTDAEPALISDPDVLKARFPQPLGEDTLRHRSGNSAGPGLRVDDDLGRQVVLDDDVRDRDPTARTEEPIGLEEHPALAR